MKANFNFNIKQNTVLPMPRVSVKRGPDIDERRKADDGWNNEDDKIVDKKCGWKMWIS